jgi:hypothetical protein
MLRGSSIDATFSNAPTGAVPAITYTQLVKGVNPTGAFDLEVYLSDNPTLAVERHRVSIAQQTDNFNQPQKISYVVNEGSNASEIIRVIPNAADDGSVVIPFDPATGAITPAVVWLSAGADGSLPTNQQIADAWADFEDDQLYPVNELVACGYTAVNIGQAMAAVAKKLNNGCEALLDVPSNVQKYEALRKYRLQEMAIDSEYATACYPDVQDEDPYTGMKIWVPNSAHVAAMTGRSDQARGIGKAPAGMQRGQIQTTAVRFEYTPTQESELFTLRLNRIRRESGAFYLMGDSTLQVKDSAFSFRSIARLVSFLQGRMRNRAKFYVFEGNTDVTVFSLKTDIIQFLTPYKPEDIAEFDIQSNEDNNPAGIIEQGNRILDVILDPVRTMRRILVRTTVTRVGGVSSIEVSEL